MTNALISRALVRDGRDVAVPGRAQRDRRVVDRVDEADLTGRVVVVDVAVAVEVDQQHGADQDRERQQQPAAQLPPRRPDVAGSSTRPERQLRAHARTGSSADHVAVDQDDRSPSRTRRLRTPSRRTGTCRPLRGHPALACVARLPQRPPSSAPVLVADGVSGRDTARWSGSRSSDPPVVRLGVSGPATTPRGSRRGAKRPARDHDRCRQVDVCHRKPSGLSMLGPRTSPVRRSCMPRAAVPAPREPLAVRRPAARSGRTAAFRAAPISTAMETR